MIFSLDTSSDCARADTANVGGRAPARRSRASGVAQSDRLPLGGKLDPHRGTSSGHHGLRYARLPQMIAKGLLIRENAKPNVLVVCYQSGDKRLCASLKMAPRTGFDIWVLSLRRMRKRQTRAMLDRGTLIRPHQRLTGASLRAPAGSDEVGPAENPTKRISSLARRNATACRISPCRSAANGGIRDAPASPESLEGDDAGKVRPPTYQAPCQARGFAAHSRPEKSGRLHMLSRIRSALASVIILGVASGRSARAIGARRTSPTSPSG